jgi:uncharacterized membrane protein
MDFDAVKKKAMDNLITRMGNIANENRVLAECIIAGMVEAYQLGYLHGMANAEVK